MTPVTRAPAVVLVVGGLVVAALAPSSSAGAPSPRATKLVCAPPAGRTVTPELATIAAQVATSAIGPVDTAVVYKTSRNVAIAATSPGDSVNDGSQDAVMYLVVMTGHFAYNGSRDPLDPNQGPYLGTRVAYSWDPARGRTDDFQIDHGTPPVDTAHIGQAQLLCSR